MFYILIRIIYYSIERSRDRIEHRFGHFFENIHVGCPRAPKNVYLSVASEPLNLFRPNSHQTCILSQHIRNEKLFLNIFQNYTLSIENQYQSVFFPQKNYSNDFDNVCVIKRIPINNLLFYKFLYKKHTTRIGFWKLSALASKRLTLFWWSQHQNIYFGSKLYWHNFLKRLLIRPNPPKISEK